MPPKRNGMSIAAIEKLIAQRVTEAPAAQDTNRNSGNHSNGDSNSVGGGERTTRHCTYKDFLNCQPLNFKGTEGAVGLAHWTVRHDAAYEMTWKNLMKMMTEAYCPRNEIQKLENEMVPKESDKVERFIWALLDSIQGNVTSSKPIRLQEAIQIANNLMD
ncbi:hypothetical protein Tco_0901227 [Tanacetum coccineum]